MNRSRLVALSAIGIFTLLLWLGGEDVSSEWVRYGSLATLGVVTLEAIYERWLWVIIAINPAQHPDLRGTWRGTLVTQWVDPSTGRSPPAKVCYLVIDQTASTVSSTLLTEESRSNSSVADVSSIGPGAKLRYLYYNEPQIDVDHRSRPHNGAGVLHVDSTMDSLEGHYWTDRNTRGQIRFTERQRKRVATYSEAESLRWDTSTHD